MATADWDNVKERVEERIVELQTTYAEVARLSTVSDTTWRKLRAGKPVRRVERGRMSRSLGWSAQSIDLLAAGEQPIVVSGMAVDLRSADDRLEQRVAALEVSLGGLRAEVATLARLVGSEPE